MKKMFLLMSIILVCMLAGCSSNKPANEIKNNDNQNVNQSQTQIKENDGNDTLARYLAYANTLENFYLDKMSMYGIQYGEPFEEPNFSENKFAINDVDGDGKEELIIVYTTDAMAGMAEYIYGYDAINDDVVEKFVAFPSITIYDNGVITADISHNQGVAGDTFWPFFLHQYHKETDKFEEVAFVDAWDKSYRETNYDGSSFPDELDIDGDGFIYFVQKGEEEKIPMDKAEYKEWLDSYIGMAKELEIPFVDYTEENYKSIEN